MPMILRMAPKPALISVILLCYKHEKFVAEALDGLFAQTYDPLDIVIIDDCSPDRSAEVIKSKLAGYRGRSNFRFVRNQKNMSAVFGIQTGLSMTQGDFIIISCGDDIMLSGMIAEMANAWVEENVSL